MKVGRGGAGTLVVTDPPRDFTTPPLPSCGPTPAGESNDLRKLMLFQGRDAGSTDITYVLEYGTFCRPREGFYLTNYMVFDTDLNGGTGCGGADVQLNINIHYHLQVEAALYAHPAACEGTVFLSSVPASLFISGGKTYLTGTLPRSLFPGASVQVNTLPDTLAAPATYTFAQ